MIDQRIEYERMQPDSFKLPRSSYEELTKIIKTYGHHHEPANLDLISSTVGINKTLISANSAFLTQIEVLEAGQKKQLSPKGRALAKALDFEMPDEIRKAWRQIVNESDFLNRVVAAVRIRKGMDEAALASHIAYSAGLPKKSYVLTGARTVTDILRAAELIVESDGQFKATTERIILKDSSSIEPDLMEPDIPLVATQTKREIVNTSSLTSNPQINVTIDIRVNCSTEDLDSIGPRIRQLLDEINNSDEVHPQSD